MAEIHTIPDSIQAYGRVFDAPDEARAVLLRYFALAARVLELQSHGIDFVDSECAGDRPVWSACQHGASLQIYWVSYLRHPRQQVWDSYGLPMTNLSYGYKRWNFRIILRYWPYYLERTFGEKLESHSAAERAGPISIKRASGVASSTVRLH